MYKAIILNKICSVKDKSASVEVESYASTSVCKDCNEPGHFSNKYFRCKLYKTTNADDERCLKKREAAGDLLVLPIDEYITSHICQQCNSRTCQTHSNVKGNSVLVCNTCDTLWQSDANAARNMMSVSLSVWNGNGILEAFRRNNSRISCTPSPSP